MAARTTAAAVLVARPDGSVREIGLAHGRTLLGAIDAHVGSLHHTRPWLVGEREEALGEMADAWFEAGGDNWLPDVGYDWLARWLHPLPRGRRGRYAEAVADLLTWAVAQGLVPGDRGDPEPPVAA